MTRILVPVTICASIAVTLPTSPASAASPSISETTSLRAAAACDPHSVLSNQTCVKCHASEIKVWQGTPHARTFDELHRRPEAKQIASKLGLSSIKNEGRCVSCHYTQQNDLQTGDVHAISGVSCESCHGAAKDWLELHHDYGAEGITRLTEPASHRRERIARSVAAGMRNPANVYLVAQSCLRCHTTADEELVNVGGHSAGSLDFEFVSWSQGSIRHNFVRSDGASNELSSQQRHRVMFVAGMIAELEASMRATAIATEKAAYGVTAAKRAARAAARLKSVTAKVDVLAVDQIVAIFQSVTLKLNNADELTAAANEIAQLGYQFAQQSTGESLESLDPFIPKRDTWK